MRVSWVPPQTARHSSVEHILRELYSVTMIEVHAVVLIVAHDIEDRRVAQSSVDFISERDQPLTGT